MKFQSTTGMIMDKPSSQSKQGLKSKNVTTVNDKETPRRVRRRSSVDSAVLSTNKFSLPCQREKATQNELSDSKKLVRRNSFSFTTKKEKDSSHQIKTTKPSSSSSSSSSSSHSTTYVTYESELKPILKTCSRSNGLRHTVSMDDALKTETKPLQGTESKFSYRLPVSPKKASIRKTVSFREDCLEEYRNKPRRFSSQSFQLTLSPTKTVCSEFVDPI